MGLVKRLGCDKFVRYLGSSDSWFDRYLMIKEEKNRPRIKHDFVPFKLNSAKS